MAIPTFIELVRAHQRIGMAVAEVGCWSGDSFVEWAPIVDRNLGTCILVDNFRGNPTAVGPHAECLERRADIYAQLHERSRPYSRVTILEGDSAEMASRVADRSLDHCFLDADHRYSHISQDILAWRNKVRPGGILCGHDCESFEHDARYIELDYVNGKHHGVIKAVSELIPNASLIADSCWIYRVPAG